MSFDAYKIAVKLSLVSNVGAGLAALSTQFNSLNRTIGTTQHGLTALESKLMNIKRLTLAGGAMAGVGAFGLSLFKGPLEEAKKFQSEVARFSALGLGEKANSEAIKFANGMNIMGQSARDNLKLLKEATSITGDLHHAMEITPLLAKMKFGISSVMGEEHGGNFERMFQDAIKVTELRGALVNRQTGNVDTGKFTQVLDMMTKAYVASGGLVKPTDYLAAIKTGGVSAKLMSDEMFFYGLGHFMQESGGSRTGTAAMSMFQNMAMGRMPQRVAERMAALGLLDQKGIHYGKTGHITGVDPMAIVNAKQFTDNPFKYVNEVVVPLLQKKGYSGDGLNTQLATLFGIRTAANLADQFVREQKIADIYVQRAGKASGIEGLYSAGGNTLAGKEMDLHAKWRDVLKELGTTVLPIAIKAAEGLISVVKGIANFAREFPTLTKWITVAFGVLSGVVAAGGVLMLATAAFSALGVALAAGGGMGSMLLSAAGGMAALAKVGGVLAAGAAGYAVGTVINDKLISGTKFGNFIGSTMAHLAAPFSEDARSAIRANSGNEWYEFGPKTTIASGPSKKIQVNTQLNIDGRKVAEAVSTHQAKEASRPMGGSTGFDGRMAPRPVIAGNN